MAAVDLTQHEFCVAWHYYDKGNGQSPVICCQKFVTGGRNNTKGKKMCFRCRIILCHSLAFCLSCSQSDSQAILSPWREDCRKGTSTLVTVSLPVAATSRDIQQFCFIIRTHCLINNLIDCRNNSLSTEHLEGVCYPAARSYSAEQEESRASGIPCYCNDILLQNFPLVVESA